jgi:hypothetical protein
VSQVKVSSAFSDHPVRHYFLTIGIVCLLYDLYWGAGAYSCLASGNSYDCVYDLGRLRELGMAVPSQPFLDISAMGHALVLTILFNMLLLPLWLSTCAPVYLGALYLKGDLSRNIFWIIAWTMAMLTFPFVVTMFSRPSPADWNLFMFFGFFGIASGVVYCF